MSNKTNNLIIKSYNCKHFTRDDDKFTFIQEIYQSCDILYLQEHWLYPNQIKCLNDIGPEVCMVGKSQMDECCPREGRPFGGVAILWKSNSKFKVQEIKMSSDRSCAIRLEFPDGSSMLAINAYMPCDNNTKGANYCEYENVLHDIETLLNMHDDCRYVIIGGDLNTDPKRNSLFSRMLSDFISSNELKPSYNHMSDEDDFTFMNGSGAVSNIDHFLLNDSMEKCIDEFEIDHDGLMFSDHAIICCSLSIHMDFAHVIKCRQFNAKYKWDRATSVDKNQYKYMLDARLSALDEGSTCLSCRDTLCTAHIEELEYIYNFIIRACIESADLCIPKTKSGKPIKVIPGWSEHVEELRRDAIRIHTEWKLNNCPTHGELFELRKESRSLYHKAIKKVKGERNKIVSEKMANCLINKDSRHFWKEVKTIKGRNSRLPQYVDNISDDKEIAEIFSNKYETLYNSVPYDHQDMEAIAVEIENRIRSSNDCHLYISSNDVADAVKCLKSGKSDGYEGVMSDHLINGSEKLYNWLAIIFRAMLTHGFVPEAMGKGTMVPIPKGKVGGSVSSDKFRAICLNSIIGKLFDLIVMNKEAESLSTSSFQFGFKKGSSTTQCTYTLIETINHYKYNRSNVHLVLLDASKAFDRVNYTKLFRLLLSRDISPLVLRMLIQLYTKQELSVRWNQASSCPFKVSNGVKQGGVLSPILYSVYTDGLLRELEESGFGCTIGNYYHGCLAYADDLALLAPTAYAMNNMVKICERYARNFDLLFNADKSVYMYFQGRDNAAECNNDVYVNGKAMNKSSSSVHLGHLISSTGNDMCVDHVKGNFWKSFNILMADFSHLNPSIKCELFSKYCTSFYGLMLLPLKKCQDIFIAYRKALRRIYKIPPHTHKYIVFSLAGQRSLEILSTERMCKFYDSLKAGHLQNVLYFAQHNPMSVTNSNVKFIDLINSDRPTVEPSAAIMVLKELISLRDGNLVIDFFNEEEINHLIYVLCTA